MAGHMLTRREAIRTTAAIGAGALAGAAGMAGCSTGAGHAASRSSGADDPGSHATDLKPVARR
ncbi:MAG: hypothetical protein JNK58_13450, partial [Phycisphaerae bacterium]|nr:hypothetical protein [Phycisphaerae bacterium]